MPAAVIGYGSVGRRHAACLARRFSPLAIVDQNPHARQAAKEHFPRASVLESTADLWRLDWPWDRSLVVIATWGPSHGALFREAIARGVRRFVCEKPLADSLYDGWRMLQEAEQTGAVLGVNHTLRYLGVESGLQRLIDTYQLGAPQSAVVHGGACGLVTNGIHYIDLILALFDAAPQRVISTARGEAINPRSPRLRFYGGSAVWSFPDGREAVISFSNRSSVYPTATFYFQHGVIHLHDRTRVEVRSREVGSVEEGAPLTRTGPAGELLYSGAVPGVLASTEEAFIRHYDEVVSGRLQTFFPDAAYRALEACVGALLAGERSGPVAFPINPESEDGRRRWPIS